MWWHGPNARFPKLSGSGDGAAAGLPGAKVFRAHRSPQAWHRNLDRPLHPRRPRRKVLRSLRRTDLGAIRRICFRTHVCVSDGRCARREQAKGAARTRETDGAVGSFCPAKQTGAQSGGAAGERPARETGKPGRRVPRRGEAEWPNARSATGRYLRRDLAYRTEGAAGLRAGR